MANNLERVVFVKDPSVLPEGVKHHDAVDNLATANKLVVLLSHGNKYSFPEGWILPANVRILEYDLDMSSIQSVVVRIRDILKEFGISLHSRHLGAREVFPIPLAGAVITMNVGTQLAFINGESDYLSSKAMLETPPTQNDPSEWDIL